MELEIKQETAAKAAFSMPKKAEETMVELCGRATKAGGKCEAVALKGKSFCYYHDPHRLRRAKAAKVRYFLELPLLAHRGALVAAISQVVHALSSNEIDSELGGKLLYALQLAANRKRLGTSPITQASPAYLRIAPVPGLARIYRSAPRPEAQNPPQTP
jgi:hypothetical protein